jgi:hypothetical protein
VSRKDPAETEVGSDANLPSEATTVADATRCPPPADDPARCSGNDPAFVFFPPLDCNLATLGADASIDAGAPGDAASGPCYGVSTLDVAFTPAACSALLAAEARALVVTDAGSRAPQMMDPSDGDTLTPDNWSIFAWSPSMARLSPIDRVLAWLEPSAYAISPLNGAGYSLEFSQGCVEFLRVMVASPFWQPDPASWALLSSRTGPITIRVVAARFTHDAMAPGTEPVASAPITITMMH